MLARTARARGRRIAWDRREAVQRGLMERPGAIRMRLMGHAGDPARIVTAREAAPLAGEFDGAGIAAGPGTRPRWTARGSATSTSTRNPASRSSSPSTRSEDHMSYTRKPKGSLKGPKGERGEAGDDPCAFEMDARGDLYVKIGE